MTVAPPADGDESGTVPEPPPPPPQRLLVSLRDELLGKEGGVTLFLASQSPRRREILGMMGLTEGIHFAVEPSPLDESSLQAELRGGGSGGAPPVSPVEYTRRLAEAKAFASADSRSSGTDETGVRYFLGSDTIVEFYDAILEKPGDEADARRMLRTMRGNRHRVHTGVALYRLGSAVIDEKEATAAATAAVPTLVESFVDTASVRFADLTDADIDAYVLSGEPMDKAGSYGIQGIGGQFVTEISGDFFTVMGLPMHRTSKLLAKALQAEGSRG